MVRYLSITPLDQLRRQQAWDSTYLRVYERCIYAARNQCINQEELADFEVAVKTKVIFYCSAHLFRLQISFRVK